MEQGANKDEPKKFKPQPALPRSDGAEQTPLERVQNFDEVARGLNREEAAREAGRCLQCRNAQCVAACPVNIDIPAFIERVREGDLAGARAKILESNLLPAICGRVCPQETYCEHACILNKGGKFKPVAIGRLERFTADEARAQGLQASPPIAKETGRKVACIGSGPSSLTVAAELRRLGHEVTVYEALHEFGGVLMYGIPTFRLPREVVRAEIDTLKKMGVRFYADVLVGRTVTVAELMEFYDLVYVGTGAGLPAMMDVEGENLVGVYSANEFLTRVNLMHADQFPRYDTPVFVGRRVLVVGGGNSAMDAARGALRLRPESVTVVYRRSRAEMPARAEEIEHAMQEGVRFEFLSAPVALEGDGKGRLKSARCVRMRLGEPDKSGRRRPEPIEGSEYSLEADSLIVAIGQSPNPIIQQTTPGLTTLKWGTLQADERGKTSKDGVYAGGDVVRGGATVLLAMRDGKVAAAAMNVDLDALAGGKKR
ncbi:MAG: NADPH-dependent glutamate synthase [Elusimicrobiota bacterium]|jgi:glutamate synthase (NADPH/NADH) small chain